MDMEDSPLTLSRYPPVPYAIPAEWMARMPVRVFFNPSDKVS